MYVIIIEVPKPNHIIKKNWIIKTIEKITNKYTIFMDDTIEDVAYVECKVQLLTQAAKIAKNIHALSFKKNLSLAKEDASGNWTTVSL